MSRFGRAGVALAVFLAGGVPAPAQTADHVTELAGAWTCRGPAGDLSTLTFRGDGEGVTAVETGPPGYAPANERYEREGDGWRVERDTGYAHFSGRAPKWTGSSWIVDDRLAMNGGRAAPSASVIRFELLDTNTFRRSFGPPGVQSPQGEVCARGSEPPDPALCAAHDVPALTLRAAMPDGPPIEAARLRINGTVRVLVSLDADSKVVGTSVISSPSALLNADATSAARRSTYRTAYHDCKPVPSTYVFSVDYSSQ